MPSATTICSRATSTQRFPIATKAARALPDDRNVVGVRTRILHGLGNYELLEAEFAQKAASSAGFDFATAYEHLYCLTKLNGPDQAEGRLNHYLSRYRQERQPDTAAFVQAQTYLQSAIVYARNDPQALLALKLPDSPKLQFSKAVVSGDLITALSLQASYADQFTATDQLLLYILASRRDDRVAAQSALATAVEMLRQSNADARSWAGWLEAPAPPDLELASLTCADIENHFLYLVTLAQRHPDCAGDALEQARKLRAVGNLYHLATNELFPEEQI